MGTRSRASGPAEPPSAPSPTWRWVGYAFLACYAAFIVTGGNAAAQLTAVLILTPLFLRATLLRRDFAGRYGSIGIGVLVVALLARPIELDVLARSLGTFAGVIGLLAYLRAMAQPLQADRYERAFRASSRALQRRGLRPPGVAVVLSFTLGQLLAYAIIPVAHQVLVVDRDDVARSRSVALWATRGFAVAIMCAITFPTVSIILDAFSVTPGQFLARALPPTSLLLLLVLALGRRDRRADAPVSGEQADPRDLRAMRWVAVYVAITLCSVVIIGSRLTEVSYLSIVAGVVGVGALGLGSLDALAGRPQGLAALRTYARRWPAIAMPEIAIFMGSGCLLYAIEVFGALDPLVSLFSSSLGAAWAWPAAPYQLACALIALLFWLGVHPLVSAVVIAQAITAATANVDFSLPTAAFAIVSGGVAGMLASPFSAINNLWASLSAERVTRITAINARLALLVIASNLAYLEALVRLGA